VGEPIVKACVQNKTHYTDVTGEPEFMERMILKYGEAAEKAGVCIVVGCGFDSLIADMAAVHAQQQFQRNFSNGAQVTIDIILSMNTTAKRITVHSTTFESAVHSILNTGALRKIRADLRRLQVTDCGEVVRLARPSSDAGWARWDSRVNRYVMLFMGSDNAVVRNSQQQLHTQHVKSIRASNTKLSAVSAAFPQPNYRALFGVQSRWTVLLLFICAAIIRLLIIFRPIRKLVLKYPGFFTLGTFTHAGPTATQMNQSSFVMELYGRGYQDAAPALEVRALSRPATPPTLDATIHTRVTGPEIGYVVAPICAIQAALTILQERDVVAAGSGGVLTPAAAFARTNIISRLTTCGIVFSVIERAAALPVARVRDKSAS